MSKQSFVNLDLSIDETDINGVAIQILNVIRPAWMPTDIKFKVSIFNHVVAYHYILNRNYSAGHKIYLYNNTPSKAIVNAASNITYRSLIEADDTGR